MATKPKACIDIAFSAVACDTSGVRIGVAGARRSVGIEVFESTN